MVEALDLEVLQRTAKRAAFRLTRNHHDREDLAQAALLRAWKVAQQGLDPRIVNNAAKWGAIDGMRQLRGRRPRPRMQSLEHDPVARTEPELRERLRAIALERWEIRKALGTVERRKVGMPDPVAIAQVLPLVTVVRNAHRQALLATGLCVTKAAKALGIGRATLYRFVRADPSLLAPP